MIAPYYLVKGARYALGMTQDEAAKEIGISPTAYRKAETGKSIRIDTWKKIMNYYRLDNMQELEKRLVMYNTSEADRKRDTEARML
jgi:DNA-binding XRE family transcriptional regulator